MRKLVIILVSLVFLLLSSCNETMPLRSIPALKTQSEANVTVKDDPNHPELKEGATPPSKPVYRWVWVKYTARLTAYGYGSEINHKGKSIRNQRGLASPANSKYYPRLKDGTLVRIPCLGNKIRKKDDHIPDGSVGIIHRANGDRVDLHLDIRWEHPYNKDLGVKTVYILEKRRR